MSPELSRYSVCCRTLAQPGTKPQQQHLRAGHRGFVFVAPESGRVVRLILYAIGLPQDTAAGHVLDYGHADIGGRRYTLPVSSIAYVRLGEYESREEITYRDYRKFSAEAAINFVEDPEPR